MQLFILLVLLFSTVLSIKEEKCKGASVCIQKCCDLNYNFNGQTCVFQNYTELTVPLNKNGSVTSVNFEEGYFTFGALKCFDDVKRDCRRLQPDDTPEHEFFVEENRYLRVPLENNMSYNFNEYCLDYYNGEISAITCRYNNSMNSTSTALGLLGSVISLPCLLVTFVIYALLPERNLHGKCLMSFVFAIFLVYFDLVCAYLNPFRVELCIWEARILLYFSFYAMLASYFWLNAMCFDICSTFSGVRGFTKNKKQTERRRFLIYSAYAWGMPLLFIILIVVLSNVLSSNEWYDPGVRDGAYWIKDSIPTVIYMYGPFSILVIANIVLYVKTVWKIKKTRDETAVLKERGSSKHSAANDDKQTFILYLKLLFGMGITLSVAVISEVLRAVKADVPQAVWYIFDFLNAAHGVFIFFIFVFKKSIWIQLKKRFCTKKNKTSKSTFPLRGRNENNDEALAERETNVDTALVTTEISAC